MKNAGGKIKTFYEKNPEDLAGVNDLRSATKGWTPLQVAAGYSADKAVAALLESGALANVPDNMGMTAMHSAGDSDKVVMGMLLATDSGKAAMNMQDNVRHTPHPALSRHSRLPAHTHARTHCPHTLHAKSC